MLALLRTLHHRKPQTYLAATGKTLSALMNGTRHVPTPKDIVIYKTARSVTSDSLEKLINVKRFTMDTKLVDQGPTTAMSRFLHKKNTNLLIFHTSTEAFLRNKSKTPLTRCVNTQTRIFAAQTASRNPLLFKRMFKSTTKNHHSRRSIFDVVLMFSPAVGTVILVVLIGPWWTTKLINKIINKTIQECMEFQGISKPSWRHFELAKQDIQLRRTAYHEAGHTLVAYFTKDARPVESVTIGPSRSQVIGHSPCGRPRTMSEVKAELDVCMGGLAAEKLIYGPDHFANGAFADFCKSKKIATLIARFGDSPSIPSVGSPRRRQLDSEIKRLLKESYARAESLLAKNRTQLDTLAEALLEQKTIEYDQLILMEWVVQ